MWALSIVCGLGFPVAWLVAVCCCWPAALAALCCYWLHSAVFCPGWPQSSVPQAVKPGVLSAQGKFFCRRLPFAEYAVENFIAPYLHVTAKSLWEINVAEHRGCMLKLIASTTTVVQSANIMTVGAPSPPIDSILAVLIVWRIRRNIIRTVFCTKLSPLI